MSAKPRLAFRGLAPGECPVAVIEIPADRDHAELLELVLKRLYGNAPVAPLTTRGGR